VRAGRHTSAVLRERTELYARFGGYGTLIPPPGHGLGIF